MNRGPVFFAAVFLLGGVVGGCRPSEPTAAFQARYHCPMHPTYVSDKPGDCPICGMRLVPMDKAAPREEKSPADPKAPLYYRHPMRPDVTSPVPLKDEMGMDYLPVYAGPPADASAVPGRAPVTLSPAQERLTGVRTAKAERRPLVLSVRAGGRVANDPDLYNAIAEYRETLKLPAGDDGVSRSAAQRLRRLGLSEGQIAALASSPGDPTDLILGGRRDAVWIYAQVYEYEAGLPRVGQALEVTGSSFPGHTWRGRVAAVDTLFDAATRTLRVRGVVRDPAGLLKPDMYVDVVLRVERGPRLLVPVESVLDTGTRRLVFVKTGPGRYAPREVRLGQESETEAEILSGLREGDEVVASAHFLIDAESKLQSALGAAAP